MDIRPNLLHSSLGTISPITTISTIALIPINRFRPIPHLSHWTPVLLWMAVIFFLSHQDKDASRNTSEWVMAVLNVLHLDIETLRAYHVPLLVRKAAHMTEYFVLFLLTHRLLNWYRPEQTNWGYALLFCIFYACTDEFHQRFVPGRGASIVDVGIDTCGATIALFVERLWQRIKHTVSLRKASSP